MKKATSVEAYLNGHPWESELRALRKVLADTELNEEIKWGSPHYTLSGKNVVGMAGFKAYFGLWFHNGVFLTDPYNVLVQSDGGNTRGLRQWRFQSIEELDLSKIKAYVAEAIANQKAGKEIKPQPKQIATPDELKEALASNAQLSEAFDSLTPGRQKEYAEYIASAKQQTTRLSRLEKCTPLILSKVGLNDRYRS
jgi:uncharacterized protein YdeI (YjbR/CyaY-like superfamily)